MIPAVKFEVGGSQYSMRLTTRAVMNIEQVFGMGIADVFASIEENSSVSSAVRLISCALNNGAGAEIEATADLCDEAGIPFLMEKFQEAAEAAFPAAKKQKAATKAA